MTDRYFSDVPIAEGPVLLTGHEAHHLIHVMRAQAGTPVVLFDGSGAEFAARVERIDRAEAELAVLSREEVDRELPRALTLGVALPKGERQRWLVEKAVELGVGQIVPLRAARSVAQPVQQALSRLRRTVIEASKQCGRNRLMQISEPQDWADYVAETGGVSCRLMAQRCGGQGIAGPPCWEDLSGPVLLAIGPEGGFTDEEVSLAVAAGWRLVDLGPRILRTETAALGLVAMVGLIFRSAR